MGLIKEAYYFSHDSNARHDPKITAMRCIYGYEGYGWFWAIVEMLREDSHFRFPLTKFQVMGLAKELDTNIETLNKFIKDCCEIGLFNIVINDKEESFLHSHSLNKRMCKYLETKEKLSIAGKKGAGIRWGGDSQAITGQCDPNSIKGKERKGKERKGKERKLKNNTYVAFEQATVELWNSFCLEYPVLSKVKEISDKRRTHLKKRYEKESFRDFKSILETIKEQPFLLGENDRSWKVSFDWLIESSNNYIKVLEKKYANTKNGKREFT